MRPMTWTARKEPIKEGDRVAFSKQFLQGTGQYTGDMPHARGTVTGLKSPGSDTTVAEIEWDTPDVPAPVNVKNLTTTKRIALGESQLAPRLMRQVTLFKDPAYAKFAN
jgi:hypothetical protein